MILHPMRHNICGQVIELRRQRTAAADDGGQDLWCPKCERVVPQEDTSIPQGTLCVVQPSQRA